MTPPSQSSQAVSPARASAPAALCAGTYGTQAPWGTGPGILASWQTVTGLTPPRQVTVGRRESVEERYARYAAYSRRTCVGIARVPYPCALAVVCKWAVDCCGVAGEVRQTRLPCMPWSANSGPSRRLHACSSCVHPRPYDITPAFAHLGAAPGCSRGSVGLVAGGAGWGWTCDYELASCDVRCCAC